MIVKKHGKLVNIPVRAGTVVAIRSSSGKLTGTKAIVVGLQKANSFSRAYGRQAYYCVFHGKEALIGTTGAGDLYPVGRAKRVPKVCKVALATYKRSYEDE